MPYKNFLTYHPYLTYSDPLNTGFLNQDGKQKENDTSDRERLFHLGKEAYKMLGECPSKAIFDEATSGYYGLIDEFRLIFSEMINDKRIILVGERTGKDLVIEDVKWDAEQITDVAWQLFSRSGSQSSDETNQVYSQFFLFHALKEIDNANIALDIGHSDAVYSGIEAANALANAMAIESGNEKLQKARQDMSMRGAKAKLAIDPKQHEKSFVCNCWQDWQKNPSNYNGKAAFAKDMLTKCEHLISQKKIEDWCRGWEKTNPAG